MTGVLDRQADPDPDTRRKLLDRALRAIGLAETETGAARWRRIADGTVPSTIWGRGARAQDRPGASRSGRPTTRSRWSAQASSASCFSVRYW